jgi:hypothetical protein
METVEVKIPHFPRPYGIIEDCLMTLESSRFSALANYPIRIPESEEIDVMRLTSVLHYSSQIRPDHESVAEGGTIGAPAMADSEKAGWTEMVIPGNHVDSRVFLIAGTSLENAPMDAFSGPVRSDLADGLSLQAI